MTAALPAHHGQDGPRDVQRTEEVGLHLGAECPVADLLEETGLERARIVDERVDATEPSDRRVNRGPRRDGVGDVERQGKEILVLAESLGDLRLAARRGSHRVAGRKSRLRDVDAHAARGAGQEPHGAVSHCTIAFRSVKRPTRRLGALIT